MAGDNFWGSLIRELREERGISQRELSKVVQVNRATLRLIEAGRTPGQIDTIEKLLAYFGYELEALDREGQRATIPQPAPEKTEAKVSKILSMRLV